jgi:hypothetical protein
MALLVHMVLLAILEHMGKQALKVNPELQVITAKQE